MLKHPAERGNTLSEYGLVAGLIALAAVGGLTMFGGSLSKLLDSPSTTQSGKDMQKMAMLNFGNGNTAMAKENAGGGTGKTTAQGNSAGNTGDPAESLLISGSSGGANTTSAEGMMRTLKNTFSIAERMYAQTGTVSSNELADWYRETTRYAYRLVGSEATFAYNQDQKAFSGVAPLLQSDLGAGDGLRGMYEMHKELSKKIDQLEAMNGGTPEEKKEALSLARQMLSELESQYGALLDKYTDGDNFKLEAVKADFGSGDQQYQQDNLHDVAQDILADKAAGSLETSLETSVTIDEKTP